MAFLDFLKKEGEKQKTSVNPSKEDVITGTNELTIRKHPEITIHDDLKGLIWFGDGPFKNYTNDNISNNTFEQNGLKIILRMTGDEEPSLIYVNQHIVIPEDISIIERPQYFPTYSGLTPEQKGVYIRLLQNPYNPKIDIGFVFILYYGLERHLLIGDYEKAFKVILKLRDVHINKSFQAYSANSIILTSMMNNRGEFALEFIQSIDKEYEFEFSDNLFLLCYYSFGIALKAKDIMRMAKTFEFTNNNYIKKYPELFKSSLEGLIKEKYKIDEIQLSKIISNGDLRRLKTQQVSVYANTSIRDKTIPVPMICDNFKLKKEFNFLLERAHEIVKKRLADMRKQTKEDKEN